jgi:hypothetical protein
MFREKMTFFVACARRIKINHIKAYFSIKFCLFTHAAQKIETLCEHVGCEGVHETYF